MQECFMPKAKILESGPLERLFSGNATAKMLDFMVASQEYDYSESDIARYSGTSLRHVQMTLPRLVKSGLLAQTRLSGRSKMYRLDKQSKSGSALEKFALVLASVDIRNELAEMPRSI